MKNEKSAVIIAILLFVLWVLLTGFNPLELLLGVGLSCLVAVALKDYASIFESVKLTRALFINIPVYLGVFAAELIKSNIDVALRVIDPRLPINPAIVKIETSLKSELGKLVLANSITLTPGTLSIDVRENVLYIHCIDTNVKSVAEASKEIGSKFENILKGIVE